MKPTRCLVALSALVCVSGLLAQSASVPSTPQLVALPAAISAVAATFVAGPATPAIPIGPTTSVTTPRAAIPSDARITNLSTRARVASDSPLITGFAISGDTPRTVLVRAVGPALGVFGVAGTLAAPHLKLHDAGGAVVFENAGWGGAPALTTAMAAAGAFPFAAGSADSAAVVTLAPGGYTVEVSDDAGRGGVVLTEIYDVNGTADGSRLTNVSTRNNDAPAGGEFISGFIVSGTQPRQFLVRGVGPGLTKFGVTGVLSDPVLTIFNSTGQRIATNDDWNGGSKPSAGAVVAVATTTQGTASGIAAQTAATVAALPDPVTVASQAAGAFALAPSSFDAALVVTLAPGAYTVQMTGGSTVVLTPTPSTTTGNSGAAQSAPTWTVSLVPASPGIGLLEIYEVP
jgi:hypothetical protein